MQGLILEGTTEDSVRLSEDLEIVGSLAPRQARVEIRAAGVCGSDLSCVLGKYYMPVPLVPGHEAAGVVLEVGSAVTYCEVGDHVILSTFGKLRPLWRLRGRRSGQLHQRGAGLAQPALCGKRATRLQLRQHRCVHPADRGRREPVHPDPRGDAPGRGRPDRCGVVTGTGAVFNRARVQIGDTVAVIGAGGVGLNVIQAARLVGASAIIAIDRVAAKEALALEFGATDFVLAEGDEFDPVAAVKSLCPSGVHHAFEVVGSTALLAQAISMTRPGGNVCAVGVPDLGAKVTYPFLDLHQNKSLLGIRAGGARPRKDFPMLADLYMRGRLKLDEMISRTAGLDASRPPSTLSRPARRPAQSCCQTAEIPRLGRLPGRPLFGGVAQAERSGVITCSTKRITGSVDCGWPKSITKCSTPRLCRPARCSSMDSDSVSVSGRAAPQ